MIDANVHISSDGRWFSTGHDASVTRLLKELDEAEIEAAAVVGLPGYIPNEFVSDLCNKHSDRLLPVGSFDPSRYPSPSAAAAGAKNELQGESFFGFKLHPRLNRYDPLDDRVLATLDEVASWPQPPAVWICTFLHYRGGSLRKPTVETFHELVGRFATLQFVLAHGGGPDILRLASAIRDCPNAFLELSYTLTKYQGSSVEQDLRHLVNTFDERLIFGSDFPEVGIVDAKQAFDAVSKGSKPGTGRKIMGDNLQRALGLNLRGHP